MASKRVPIVCHGHSRPIVEVNYSTITPDGYFLASASKDGQPMLRHGENGDWYGTFMGHKGAVWSCVLNQPALLCATGSADFSARVWDACSGTQLHEFQHAHIVRTVAFSHIANKLATGGAEKVIRVYDLDKPDAPPQQLPPGQSGLRCLSWVQDDNMILASYSDKSGVGMYDSRTLQLVRTLETSAPVTSLEVSFDMQYMTTAEGRTVRFFDLTQLKQIKEVNLPQGAASASYNPLKRKFVTGGEDMWVHLYDFDSQQELECNKGHHGPIHTIRFAPTYDSYASGSEDGTIRIWSTESTSVVDANGNGNGNGAAANGSA